MPIEIRWFFITQAKYGSKDLVPARNITEAISKRRLATHHEGDVRELTDVEISRLKSRGRLSSTLRRSMNDKII